MLNINDIKPIGARLLIKIQEKPTETDGGLILNDSASNSAPVMGEVIEVGDKSQIEIGMTVFFRRYAVDELKIPNDKGDEDVVFFIEDADVLGIIKKVEIIKDKYKAIKDKQLNALNNIKDNADDETKSVKEGVSQEGGSQEGSPKKGRKKAS